MQVKEQFQYLQYLKRNISHVSTPHSQVYSPFDVSKDIQEKNLRHCLYKNERYMSIITSLLSLRKAV